MSLIVKSAYFTMRAGPPLDTSESLTCQLEWAQCSPCIRPPCTYRWIDRVNNQTVSLKRQISLTEHHGSSYSFQCQIVCIGQEAEYSINADVVTCIRMFQLYNYM